MLTAVNDLKDNKKIIQLGVDYETMNPLARVFWEKYFTPYTKTVTRRIDEGMLEIIS
ncbi:MAG: hypothetical protein UMR38_03220 [Candidatus Izemoplasma sp.]|nr:hypothetical protein [Candidatus Izemoplasma sp.]